MEGEPMIAKVVLTCSRCGKEFEMSHGVDTIEEKESWEKWALETYKSPYCPECSKVKSRQSQKMKRGDGYATGWW